LRWIARKTRQDAGLALDAHGLVPGKQEIAGQSLMDLSVSPFGLHDACGGVAGFGEQQMTK
jgi:hypothetical protein